jgi:hypothetical protein
MSPNPQGVFFEQQQREQQQQQQQREAEAIRRRLERDIQEAEQRRIQSEREARARQRQLDDLNRQGPSALPAAQRFLQNANTNSNNNNSRNNNNNLVIPNNGVFNAGNNNNNNNNDNNNNFDNGSMFIPRTQLEQERIRLERQLEDLKRRQKAEQTQRTLVRVYECCCVVLCGDQWEGS